MFYRKNIGSVQQVLRIGVGLPHASQVSLISRDWPRGRSARVGRFSR
ncbi:hypothetical protein [Rhizobium terrae]|nr:hypothetical protein [Rhizobium terrae]